MIRLIVSIFIGLLAAHLSSVWWRTRVVIHGPNSGQVRRQVFTFAHNLEANEKIKSTDKICYHYEPVPHVCPTSVQPKKRVAH